MCGLYDALHDCADELVVWRRREKITQWHCVITQKNMIFMYLLTKHEIPF